MHNNRRAMLVLLLTLLTPLVLAACGKTVGETIDDASITTRVKTALLNDLAVGVQKIDVDTFKGVVTLSGRGGDRCGSRQGDRYRQKSRGRQGRQVNAAGQTVRACANAIHELHFSSLTF